jgi:environmental stress-induced protein Ves
VPESRLQIIRRSSFVAAPWKNGGGVTHEAIRVPASGDPFRWRVSVAHIDSSGPFSEFPAHNRHMVLLKGAGIELRFGGEAHEAPAAHGADAVPKILRQVGELVKFDGAAATYCELLKGPCVDLNLMVSKTEGAAVRVERFLESCAVGATGHETALVFPIDAGITLQINGGQTAALEAWDLAVLSHCSGRINNPAPADSSVPAMVFVATLTR